MLKNRLFSSAIVLAGGLFATTALANTGEKEHGVKQGQDVGFEEIDANSDGYISQSELEESGKFQVDHSTLDQDSDGRVDQSEFAAFEQMVDGDQQQGQQEFQTQPDPSQPDPTRQDPTQQESEFETDPTETERDY